MGLFGGAEMAFFNLAVLKLKTAKFSKKKTVHPCSRIYHPASWEVTIELEAIREMIFTIAVRPAAHQAAAACPSRWYCKGCCTRPDCSQFWKRANEVIEGFPVPELVLSADEEVQLVILRTWTDRLVSSFSREARNEAAYQRAHGELFVNSIFRTSLQALLGCRCTSSSRTSVRGCSSP